MIEVPVCVADLSGIKTHREFAARMVRVMNLTKWIDEWVEEQRAKGHYVALTCLQDPYDYIPRRDIMLHFTDPGLAVMFKLSLPIDAFPDSPMA